MHADDGTGDCGEVTVDVDPAFVSNYGSSVAVDPGEAALDDPSMAAKLLRGMDNRCFLRG